VSTKTDLATLALFAPGLAGLLADGWRRWQRTA
jgi:hypothetical protein